MLEIFNLKSESFGLHLANSSVKFIKLKRRGDFFDLASFNEFPIKSGVIREGEVINQKSLIKAIKNCLAKPKGEKLKTKNVIASLPEEKAFLQIIQMPVMLEEDLKSAIVYQAEKYIPLPISEVYLDFQIIKKNNNHSNQLDVLIAALPKKTVDDYLFCLKEAGLKPKALEIESLALARVAIKDQVGQQSPTLLVDINDQKMNLVIFNGDSVCFASSFPIFLESSSSFKYLLEQIEKHIDYYATYLLRGNLSLQNRKLNKILLCGKGANNKSLINFLSSKLTIPVEKINPFVNIPSRPEKWFPEFYLKQAFEYVIVLGLALRGIKEL